MTDVPLRCAPSSKKAVFIKILSSVRIHQHPEAMLEHPLILTLWLDSQSFDVFNQLRQQHFPAERNFLPAHVTLFHQLPGQHESEIQQMLQTQCACTPTLTLTFARVRFLGQGVAIHIDCLELVQLRQQLAAIWQHWLNRQDQQHYQPHITLQNKTTAEAAQQLYQQLSHDWQPRQGQGEGLLLWRYLGGPWELVQKFQFASNLEQPTYPAQRLTKQ